ncbi:MAG: HIT domain-containing protein [Desulfobacterota bacterium]|nr:HIT domain-containing protein [Thermodesulfobacteriota bacterium]MDW8002095.1 HIT domain-containing protein [Deltaproteobacteria bacterium]
MERLWAPWRVEYITTPQKADSPCFLCIDGIEEEKALIVAKLKKAFVIMNRYPYSSGHVMIAPIRHVGLIEDLTEEEALEILRLLKIASTIFKEDFKAQGLNIGLNIGRAAGAGLEDHIHVHVVPRWFGDTNFMPVIAETKVISEHLYSTYEKLRARFSEKLK